LAVLGIVETIFAFIIGCMEVADTESSRDFDFDEQLPEVSAADRKRLLSHLLRSVSRTFYFTLRVLPKGIREPICVAYLLARAADTISDTQILPHGERLKYLLAFRSQVDGPANSQGLREIEQVLTDKQSVIGERALLTSLREIFSFLESLPEPDRGLVCSVVVTLTYGMEIDLTAFPAENLGKIAAFKKPNELDKYTYYVAGCVGEFWTLITMAHLRPLQSWNAERMSERGVAFGKALQLTNILRDVPRDLRIGRCYMPESEITRAGLSPPELLDPAASAKARPVLVTGIVEALDNFQIAEEYLLAIPRRCIRLRLAVMWPIMIGLATLAQLARSQSWLEPGRPSKVRRWWIYRMLVLSLIGVPCNGILRYWLARLRRRVDEVL
jgi:farnesyl-diphosphate farnesyltransferase